MKTSTQNRPCALHGFNHRLAAFVCLNSDRVFCRLIKYRLKPSRPTVVFQYILLLFYSVMYAMFFKRMANAVRRTRCFFLSCHSLLLGLLLSINRHNERREVRKPNDSCDAVHDSFHTTFRPSDTDKPTVVWAFKRAFVNRRGAGYRAASLVPLTFLRAPSDVWDTFTTFPVRSRVFRDCTKGRKPLTGRCAFSEIDATKWKRRRGVRLPEFCKGLSNRKKQLILG